MNNLVYELRTLKGQFCRVWFNKQKPSSKMVEHRDKQNLFELTFLK